MYTKRAPKWFLNEWVESQLKNIFSFYMILINEGNYKAYSYKNMKYTLNGKIQWASDYHLFIFTERRNNLKIKWYQI